MQTKPTAPGAHIPKASMRAFLSLSCWARAGPVNIDYMGLFRRVASGSPAWAIALKTLHYNMSVVPLLAVPYMFQDMRILLFVVGHAWLTALCQSLSWVKPWAMGVCANQKADVLPGCNSMSDWIKRSDFFFPEISSNLLSAWIQPIQWINESYDTVQICFSVALINQCCKILGSDSESG